MGRFEPLLKILAWALANLALWLHKFTGSGAPVLVAVIIGIAIAVFLIFFAVRALR